MLKPIVEGKAIHITVGSMSYNVKTREFPIANSMNYTTSSTCRSPA